MFPDLQAIRHSVVKKLQKTSMFVAILPVCSKVHFSINSINIVDDSSETSFSVLLKYKLWDLTLDLTLTLFWILNCLNCIH